MAVCAESQVDIPVVLPKQKPQDGLITFRRTLFGSETGGLRVAEGIS
ncbi:MAG: hypothetical protein MK110_18630 [Fuerstiella sp.]|nr:hypothetical protein [Fuerstiella sp.]